MCLLYLCRQQHSHWYMLMVCPTHATATRSMMARHMLVICVTLVIITASTSMTITEINAVFLALDLAANTRSEANRFRAKMVDVLLDMEMRGLMSNRLSVSPTSEPRK